MAFFQAFHQFRRFTFSNMYESYPLDKFPTRNKDHLEKGGKIILPTTALHELTMQNVSYPMMFRLTNVRNNKTTHCGVQEFDAPEGRMYLPKWMMENLEQEAGLMVLVEYVSLPVATFSKFQPFTSDFLEITDPKAVLENCLRLFTCLSKNDTVVIYYNDQEYKLKVLETQPGDAVNIIECDMSVDFALPLDYKEPVKEEVEPDYSVMMPNSNDFRPFSGEGQCVGGKPVIIDAMTSKTTYVRGIPNFDYKPTGIRFIRNSKPPPKVQKEEPTKFEAFSGSGQKLGKPK